MRVDKLLVNVTGSLDDILVRLIALKADNKDATSIILSPARDEYGDWLKTEATIVRSNLEIDLAESIKREGDLEQRLAACLERERKLTSSIGTLVAMATKADALLKDVADIGKYALQQAPIMADISTFRRAPDISTF